ncbi:DNA polymerase III subunit delta [Blautia liquoris]|uniref:DNA polymerase III subunit delta' n=1 Tax=Blautia liquoris TaxID=2779518 RepID=A0A7M2RJC3_9FIRM|nr:DNA polymerase III subunit delta' C-terminal domain-containing protein [Blautia liquoris]QOV19452.1 DNA polymerase III subunit delta [Blautia liquoris]
MSGFDDVLGQEKIIKHLQNAILMNKVSHAYIFSGERGAGKKLLASLFAMTLLCEKQGIDPCMECASCKKAMSRNHPDIINVIHEKPGSIGIKDIREQLVDDVEIRPYSGPYKIYIINDAQKMTLQAQNALLKTIEEPPIYAIILLLTDNPDAFLPTITSRCVTLALRPASDNVVKSYLMDRMHIPDYQAEIDASLAQGNIGRAKQAATSAEFAQLTQNALHIVEQAENMQIYELVDAVKEMSNDKNNITDYLDIFTMWFRDVLLFKATREIDSLVFKQEINHIKERAQMSSYEGLEHIIDAIETARIRLSANVNFDLTMELLFLTIKEN